MYQQPNIGAVTDQLQGLRVSQVTSSECTNIACCCEFSRLS
jgi:hypothetical protein